tara:strand:+ start:161 stop:1123 length:963 start_codon:yes stop_codon:yes gene_type:complete
MGFPISKFREYFTVMVCLFFVLYGLVDTAYSTTYKKKIAVGEFIEPDGWSGSYSSSAVIKVFLEKALINNEKIDLIKISNDSLGVKKPYQYLIRGKILKFEDTPELVEMSDSLGGKKKQYGLAKIVLELLLESSITGNILLNERITGIMPLGDIPFKVPDGQVLPSEHIINKSGVGKVLKDITVKSLKIVESFVNNKNFEALIINVFPDPIKIDNVIMKSQKSLNKSISPSKIKLEKKLVKWVTINAGRKNNIKFLDRFYVYNVKPNYVDPLTNYDIGSIWNLVGVVRVNFVGENYSTAVVEAGEGFTKEQIVRPYNIGS